jgi:lipoyl(octanoyl) transferase
LIQSDSLRPAELINLVTPESIWEALDYNCSIQFFWLGRQPYAPIWELQKQLHKKRVSDEIPNIVLLLEHENVYTFGKNSDTDLLLDSKPHDAEIVQIDRGGQVTYHGPGQLVGYPILDLHNYNMSVSWYMRSLEDVIISCLHQLGIDSTRKEDLPGVWVEDNKICAMGVRLSRWVTMHGFALNLDPDMKYFEGMIPCGIFNYGVTSLKEQDINIPIEMLVDYLINSFLLHFEGNSVEV